MRAFLSFLLAMVPTIALAVPLELSHQGRLFDALGAPMTGAHDVRVDLFDVPSSGTSLWGDDFTSVTFSEGFYTLQIGDGAALDTDVFDDNDELFLELTIDTGPPLATRLPLSSVPFALRARTADSVSGGVVDASEIRVNGTTVIDGSGTVSDTLSGLGCSVDQVAVYTSTGWACGANVPAHVHNADDIETGTLSVDRLPVGGTAGTVSAGDHTHPDLVITEGQVETWVTNGAINLAAGSQVGGEDVVTSGSQLTESDVEGYITNGAIDLDSGTTIGGADVLVGDRSLNDVGWMMMHSAAAAACRGSTASGGTGCCGNVVRVRNTASGSTCSSICSANSETCDAEVSVWGRPGKASANGEAVGSFYNYGCTGSANGGSEASTGGGNVFTQGYWSFCCCRK